MEVEVEVEVEKVTRGVAGIADAEIEASRARARHTSLSGAVALGYGDRLERGAATRGRAAPGDRRRGSPSTSIW
ncbi:hypothetical protein WMF45_50340 [Sorangium sp. So ce448]|uniref:hypothetical protein n=1 Tax=Sorangium sp. So ce448 TaxID=3133314 RepID=UPI003F5DDC01